VILTPHTAFYSVEALEELQTKCASDVARVLSGEKAGLSDLGLTRAWQTRGVTCRILQGFDIAQYPKQRMMDWLKANSNLSWCGYYFAAPNRPNADGPDNTIRSRTIGAFCRSMSASKTRGLRRLITRRQAFSPPNKVVSMAARPQA